MHRSPSGYEYQSDERIPPSSLEWKIDKITRFLLCSYQWLQPTQVSKILRNIWFSRNRHHQIIQSKDGDTLINGTIEKEYVIITATSKWNHTTKWTCQRDGIFCLSNNMDFKDRSEKTMYWFFHLSNIVCRCRFLQQECHVCEPLQ